jgi:ectoine hydroxylase-related dioxygenase (phytanoyl-CoA dioxygenase family)
MQSYGITRRAPESTPLAMEELTRRGFTVLPGVLSPGELAEARCRLDAVHERQVAEFGSEALERIAESQLVRSPLCYDDFFLGLAARPAIVRFAQSVLGEFVILHLQNGIIVRPGVAHHQASWHRDLPYQDWTSSRPLALGMMVCLDDFNPATGGTQFVPFSHRFDHVPSEEYLERHRTSADVPAGSAVAFDAMVVHRAGSNTSPALRRGINHVFSVPILKQQIDLPCALGPRPDLTPQERELFGYTSAAPPTVLAWRKRRLERKQAA